MAKELELNILCVCGLNYPACKAIYRIKLSFPACLAPRYFSTFLINDTAEKKLLNVKLCFDSPDNFYLKCFSFYEESARCVQTLVCEVDVILVRFK